MTRIKICGIKTPEDALAAAGAGSDFIGLVFATGRRQVTPEQARKIADAMQRSGLDTRMVGVFVNEDVSKVNSIADTCDLDWVQLSGDESLEYCSQIRRPVIKALRAGPDLGSRLADTVNTPSRQRRAFLIDTHIEGKYGGTGTTFDWSLAEGISETYQVILAGGLKPENVGAAIKTIRPWGVDVSSGVETGEGKDINKIRAFISEVRKADGRQA